MYFYGGGHGPDSICSSLLTLSVYLAILAIGTSLNQPTILGLVSQEAKEENVGLVMGTSQSIQGLGRMCGPAWGGFLFSIAAGLPFYATALVTAGTIIIGIKVLYKVSVQETVPAE